MKFGISMATFDLQFGPVAFRGEDVQGHLETISRLGYDGVDLFMHRVTDSEVDTLLRLLEKYQLSVGMAAAIWVAESGLSLTDQDKSSRRKVIGLLTEHIRFVGKMGGCVPIGFLRGPRGDRSEEEYLGLLAEGLSRLSEVAQSAGADLAIEPINRYEIDSFHRIDQVLSFIREYNLQGVTLLPDTFHMNIEESDIWEALRSAGSLISHIHCSDTNRLYPGAGHLDYARLFETLKEIEYDRFLAVESPPAPDRDTCAREGLATLQKAYSESEGEAR